MYPRHAAHALTEALARQPAAVLLGPRQVGKTTLAHALTEARDALYVDLERPQDRAMLAEPEAFFRANAGRLLILDEIQRAPGLFEILRGVIDGLRRRGRAQSRGRFLLLGSASLELLKQSSESLAGRVALVELGPLQLTEVGAERQDALWSRGGFPESLLADDDAMSLAWREDFLTTYLERDIPQFGPRVAQETLRRLWTMLAHDQGGMLNASRLGQALGVSATTVHRYIDLLVDLLLVRRLPSFSGNTFKRLRKAPKVYIRDSGLVHALLHIRDTNALLAHPVAGASWEGCVVEHVVAALPRGTHVSYYRTQAGAEVDLVLELPQDERWVVEIKRSDTPKLGRGFHEACLDVAPSARFVVYPGQRQYQLPGDVTVLGLHALVRQLQQHLGA